MRILLIACLAAMPAIPAYAQKLPKLPDPPPLIAPPILVPGVVVVPATPSSKGKGWAKGHANKSVKGHLNSSRSAGKGW